MKVTAQDIERFIKRVKAVKSNDSGERIITNRELLGIPKNAQLNRLEESGVDLEVSTLRKAAEYYLEVEGECALIPADYHGNWLIVTLDERVYHVSTKGMKKMASSISNFSATIEHYKNDEFKGILGDDVYRELSYMTRQIRPLLDYCDEAILPKIDRMTKRLNVLLYRDDAA